MSLIEELQDTDDGHTRREGWYEVLSTVLLAAAAVLTAWAAFQSTKWSGVQANSYAQASAARVESTRVSNATGQNLIADTTMFTAWVGAVFAEERFGLSLDRDAEGIYQPDPARQSGFLYARFRDGFKPVVDAWVSTHPLLDPAAPPTPFDMPGYAAEDLRRAQDLEADAERLSADARQANQRADNYVLATSLFALVLVLVGLSAKLSTNRARTLLLVMATAALLVTGTVVAFFPKEV